MAVDLMHDVELGVEKQVLLHHLRIFNAVGKGTVERFDSRLVEKSWCDHFLTVADFLWFQRSDAIPSGGLVKMFLH